MRPESSLLQQVNEAATRTHFNQLNVENFTTRNGDLSCLLAVLTLANRGHSHHYFIFLSKLHRRYHLEITVGDLNLSLNNVKPVSL